MIHFSVIGLPAPQGSLKGYVNGSHVGFKSDNPKTKPWRHEVAAAAREACPGGTPTARSGVVFPRGVPVAVGAVFRFPLPKKWLDTKGRVKPGAPLFPSSKPDRDKLLRAIGDALTAAGCIWDDDSQDAIGMAVKVYVPPGEDTGVEIWIDHAVEWRTVNSAVAMALNIARDVAAYVFAMAERERATKRHKAA